VRETEGKDQEGKYKHNVALLFSQGCDTYARRLFKERYRYLSLLSPRDKFHEKLFSGRLKEIGSHETLKWQR